MEPASRGDDQHLSEARVLRGLVFALGIGLIVVTIVPTALGMGRAGLIQLMIAGAATAMGALLGFLFGVPRTLQQDRPAPSGGDNGAAAGPVLDYRFNTNLEQISDWLTKILVGVGLTQLTEVGPALQRVAGVAAEGIDEPSASAIAAAGIVFFLIGGFLLGYLWTRLVYPRLLVAADTSVARELSGALASLERRMDDLAEGTAAAVQHGVGGLGSPPETAAPAVDGAEEAEDALPPPTFKNDPQRGRFGGKARVNGRRLTASVSSLPGHDRWFKVTLLVEPEDDAPPLEDPVRFYVHHTFRNNVFDVEPERGVVRTTLVAYGAFTVGAVADRGKTKLELDLSKLDDAPREFREN